MKKISALIASLFLLSKVTGTLLFMKGYDSFMKNDIEYLLLTYCFIYVFQFI